jgi:hypothetical protein
MDVPGIPSEEQVRRQFVRLQVDSNKPLPKVLIVSLYNHNLFEKQFASLLTALRTNT